MLSSLLDIHFFIHALSRYGHLSFLALQEEKHFFKEN